MGYETDARFNPARFRSAPEPRKYDAVARDGEKDEAVRRAYFEASAKKMNYRHGVVVGKGLFARDE